MRTPACALLTLSSSLVSPYLDYSAGDDFEGVLQLNPDNFDTEVGGSTPALVAFTAPWCGHCKSLANDYAQVAAAFKSQNVKIAQVNADQYKELATRFQVRGFPTIKWFPAGSITPEVCLIPYILDISSLISKLSLLFILYYITSHFSHSSFCHPVYICIIIGLHWWPCC